MDSSKPMYLAKSLLKCHFAFHRSFLDFFDPRLNPTKLFTNPKLKRFYFFQFDILIYNLI
jgi:hypothetical protein